MDLSFTCRPQSPSSLIKTVWDRLEEWTWHVSHAAHQAIEDKIKSTCQSKSIMTPFFTFTSWMPSMVGKRTYMEHLCEASHSSQVNTMSNTLQFCLLADLQLINKFTFILSMGLYRVLLIRTVNIACHLSSVCCCFVCKFFNLLFIPSHSFWFPSRLQLIHLTMELPVQWQATVNQTRPAPVQFTDPTLQTPCKSDW